MSNKPKKKMYHCSNCCTKINIENIVFRCADTYVCSPECARDRLKMIRKIDPEINSPNIWPLQNPKYNTIFNSKIISNRNKDNKSYWLNTKNINSVSKQLYKYNNIDNNIDNNIVDNMVHEDSVNKIPENYDPLDHEDMSNLNFVIDNQECHDRRCITLAGGTLCLITIVMINFYN
uniref:MYM-type domain-containing protein n=1 Tax=Florenciella sp. virus SA2 TaxID=3240092 RepID=A0AB39JC49_9VIRU